jgi:hypothetical protein
MLGVLKFSLPSPFLSLSSFPSFLLNPPLLPQPLPPPRVRCALALAVLDAAAIWNGGPRVPPGNFFDPKTPIHKF